MKTIRVKKYHHNIGTLYLFFLALLFIPAKMNAQKSIYATVIQHESCDEKDGVAQVFLPDNATYNIKWTYPKGGTSSGQTISGLGEGTYSVEVTSPVCPGKPLYKGTVTIQKDKPCDFPVSISVTSSWSCENQVTTLYASASGGTSPYRYSWPNQTYSTSQTGSFTVSVFVTDSKGKQSKRSQTVYVAPVQCSKDPNEIKGPAGFGESQMTAQKDKMDYTIMYENDPDFATAPASRVKITYPVGNKQNINSFRLNDFGFGPFVFTVPQNTTSYYKRLDVSDTLGVWVDVTAGIDIVNNELFWIFQSLDPQTGIEPANAQMGYLPINNSDLHNGEGYVNFSIFPSLSTITGDTVLAEASIVFDDNAAIATNIWLNIIDALPPTSSLTGSRLNDTTVSVAFSGYDDNRGSGVKNYLLYVSTNEEEYLLYGRFLPDSICTFPIEAGAKYKFFSIAEDNVGNIEAMKTTPEFEIGELKYQIMAESTPFDGGITFGSGEYAHGEPVSVKARANSGYVFTNWTLNNEVVQLDSIMNFTALRTVILLANFLPQYPVTINVNPINTGTFTGEGAYVYGDVVRVKATPEEGYKFVNWTNRGEVVSTRNEYEFPVYEITGLVANFEKQDYNVLITQNPETGGILQGDTSGVYLHSDTVKVAAAPGHCYDFADWSVNGTSVTGDTLSLAVKENLNITANYTLKSYDVQISAEPDFGGSLSGDGTRVYNCGDTLNVSAQAVTCYDFKHWTRNGTVVSNESDLDWIVTEKDTIIAHFELTQYPVKEISAFICQGDSYRFLDRELTATGVYRDTLQNRLGCDSIIELFLTVHPVSLTRITASTYEGTPYHFGGKDLTVAGIYYDTLENIYRCDSVVELTLTIESVIRTPIAASACQGTPYHFGGRNLTESGIYRDTLQAMNGWDSIVELTLTVNPVITTPLAASTCQGAAYRFGGRDLTVEGTYRDTLQTTNSCDSIVELTLTVHPNVIVNLGGDRTLDLLDSVTLTVEQGHHYLWSTGDTIHQVVINRAKVDGDTATVWVLVTNINNCIGGDTIRIIFKDKSGIDILDAKEIFVVYPNPTTGKINIEFTNPAKRDIHIYSIDGKTIYRKKHSERKVELDLAMLKIPSGTYVVSINNKEVKKIIVK